VEIRLRQLRFNGEEIVIVVRELPDCQATLLIEKEVLVDIQLLILKVLLEVKCMGDPRELRLRDMTKGRKADLTRLRTRCIPPRCLLDTIKCLNMNFQAISRSIMNPTEHGIANSVATFILNIETRSQFGHRQVVARHQEALLTII
jgi:hypothetical protein